MATPDTPSGNPIAGHSTPVPASSSNVLASSIPSIPPSPVTQPLQPIQLAEPALDQLRTSQSSPTPAPTLVPILQPLPRGRPPKPKLDPPPPASHWHHGSQVQDIWAEPASAAPVIHAQPPQSQLQLQFGRPPPEAAYVRGGHLLGGFNPARYTGNTTAHPKFNLGGRVLILTNANSLLPWVQQISYIARSLSCFDELTKRFTSFPQPCTIQLFICETRFATAFRVLEGSISGPVWAYMRVLGYSSIPETGDGIMSPTPADCFEYAKLAASKMGVPGTPEQPLEERKRMVQEILTAQATDYPAERVYKKGIQWLRLACDNLIRQGDYELAESLYDPLPDWAPRPPGYEEPTVSAASNGEEPPVEQNGHPATPATEATNRSTLNGVASTPAASHPTKLVPEGQKLGKRKRAKKDVGPKLSKMGEPASGAETSA